MKKILIVSLMVIMLVSSSLFAKTKREGFNFGAEYSFLANNMGYDEYDSVTTDTTSIQRSKDGYLIMPRIGYAYDDIFNYGVIFTFRQTKEVLSESNSVTGSEIKKTSKDSLSGYGVFGRLLFGRYFYWEAAGSIYFLDSDQERETIVPGTSLGIAGNISTKDKGNLSGKGQGFNLGLGVEVPIHKGFVFNTSLIYQFVEVSKLDGTARYAKNSLKERELMANFGISYYFGD